MRNNATHKDRSELEHNDRSNLDIEELDGLDPESKMLTYGQIKSYLGMEFKVLAFCHLGFLRIFIKNLEI